MTNMYPEWATEVGGVPTFWGVYISYHDECTEGWEADSTLEKYDRILTNHILPNLKNHNRRTIDSYTRDELVGVIAFIEKLGKNGENGPFIPYDYKTIQSYEYAMRRVMEVAAKHYLWSDTFNTTEPNRKGHRPKKQFVRVKKTLTRQQELAIIPCIASDPAQSGEKMALYLMYILGVRNAEACGYNFGNIMPMLTHPECQKIRILETTEVGSNQLQASGKTSNAPRYSPLIDSASQFLDARREYVKSQLIEQGFTNVNIDELPITCAGHNFFKRCSADNVTDAARELFHQLGFKHKTLCAINRQRMVENAQLQETLDDEASDLVERDLTAYILRRTYATHLAAIGMEQSKIEYLIGHLIQSPYDTRNDLSHEETLYEMKQELEKRPLVGTNCLNHDIVNLIPGECVTSTRSHTKTFVIPADTACVQLSVTAKEPGDAVQIIVLPSSEEIQIRKDCIIFAIAPSKYPRTIDIDKTHQYLYKQSSSKKGR